MLKKKIILYIISIFISIFLIWLLLSKIETDDLSTTFKSIHYPALLAFIIIALISSGLRAWRYKLLLKPHPISWKNILLVTFIRNLFVDLFPARLGSLSYIYVINRRMKFSFETATSSFVLAVIFDFFTLSPFLIFSIFIVGLGSSAVSSTSLLIISFLFFLIIFLALWLLIPLTKHFFKLYSYSIKFLRVDKKIWAVKIKKTIEKTIKELAATKKRRIYWPVFSISLALRLAKYGALYFLLYSILFSHGFNLHDLNFFKTILGITGAELTSILPIKGLGGFGTWESAWVITFKLMNFQPQLAIISGIGVHLITNLFEYILGILSIIIISLPFKKNRPE